MLIILAVIVSYGTAVDKSFKAATEIVSAADKDALASGVAGRLEFRTTNGTTNPATRFW